MKHVSLTQTSIILQQRTKNDRKKPKPNNLTTKLAPGKKEVACV
jgi:hypothetical protein